METVRYSRIGKEDIRFGTGTFEVRLASGAVVVLTEVDLGNILSDAALSTQTITITSLTANTTLTIPSSTTANRATAGTVGRLHLTTDVDSGTLFWDDGTNWVRVQRLYVVAQADLPTSSTTTAARLAFVNDVDSGAIYFDNGTSWRPLMRNPLTTAADLLTTDSSGNPARLAAGTANQVVGMNSGATAQEYKTITAGTGVSVSHAAGAVTIAATAGLPTAAIVPYAGTAAPTGFLLCDGSSYSTATYADLWGVIGYTWGGAGANFNVPDLRGRFPLGKDNMGGSSANRATDTEADNLGQAAGSEAGVATHNHTASTDSQGNHNHIVRDMGSGGAGGFGLTNLDGAVQYNSQTTTNAGSHTHTVTVDNNGTSTGNMPPYLTVNYIIKT